MASIFTGNVTYDQIIVLNQSAEICLGNVMLYYREISVNGVDSTSKQLCNHKTFV